MNDQMDLHELCALFPPLEGDDLAGLVADIKAHGLRQPIITYEGKILDGQNRYRACLLAGVKPLFTPYGGRDPAAYVEGQNLHRRHLSAGQRSLAVAALQDWRAAHSHGGDRKSEIKRQPLPLDPPPSTVAARAEKAGASDRTQRMADFVAKKGGEQVVHDVMHGKTTLPKAVEQITGKVRAKPAAPTVVDELAANGAPSAEELYFCEQAAKADAERVRVLLEADEPLAAVTARWQQAEAMVAKLNLRVQGLLTENAELIREVKRLRRAQDRAAA